GPPHLGALAARSLRRPQRAFTAVALPHADRRRVAHRAATGGQHRSHRHRGTRGCARWHAVIAHQLDGRSAGAADREGGAHRVADPTGHRPRDGCRQRRRPARWVVVRRGAHRRDGSGGRGDVRPYRRARRRLDAARCVRGHRQRLVPGRHRRRCVPVRAQGQQRRAHRRRRQPLHRGQRRGRARPAADHPRTGAATGQAVAGGEGRSRQQRSRCRARTRARGRRRSRAQPDAVADRRRARVRHRRRADGRDGRRLRPLRREPGAVTHPRRVTAAMCAYGRAIAEPKLSPDGTRVAFVANVLGRAQLIVVPATGGAELTVTSDPPPRPVAAYGGGAFDWTPDGEHLVYAATDGGLWIVPSTGGAPRPVVSKQPDGGVAAPAVSPDGARVAFVVNQQHVAVAPLDGDAWPVRLSTDADFCCDPAWHPDGTEVVWHEWSVPAMPWDESRIAARAADGSGPVKVLAGGPGVSVQQPRFSPDGTRLAYLCDEHGWLNLWVDGAPLVEEECEHGDPSWGLGQRSFAWAPDGRAIAFVRNDNGFGSLEVRNIERGDVTQVGRGVHGGISWRGARIAAVRS